MLVSVNKQATKTKSNFSNRYEPKSLEKLIAFLNKQFIENGFRNFSMNEVANELKISKKTIYKVYRKKEEIIRIVLIKQLTIIYSEVLKIIKSQTNLVEKLNSLSRIIEEYYSVYNEDSIKRLEQHFPELADYITQFRIHRIIPLIHTMLNEGKKNDLISDISNETIIKVFNSSLTKIAESKSEYQSGNPYHKNFREAFDMLMNGILTTKGKQFFKNKSEEKNENN